MIGLWNVNWLNQNSQRAYPLNDLGSKTALYSPEVRLPDDFLLGLRISVHTGHNVRLENFFVKSLAVSGAGCTVTLGYNDGSTPEDCPDVAVCYAKASQDITNCRLSGIGAFADTVGYAAFNGQSSLFTNLLGYYVFAPEETGIEPDCIVPMLRSVTSLCVDDGSETSKKYYGDIRLVAGANMSISTKTVGTTTIFTFNALATTGFEDDCPCDVHDAVPCIKMINGVTPDSTGNIQIKGVDCVSVKGSGNTITLTDVCASPDCGCVELENLAASVREMEDGKTTLKMFLEDLYQKVTQAAMTIEQSDKCAGCPEISDS